MITEDFFKTNVQTSNNDLPQVSIVTPAYNAEKFIEDTIRSVKNQDYPYIEHIVLDDGSIDSTSRILKKYQREYDLRVISKQNEGQTITVNKGFDLAKGEIVVWLNADDVLFNRQVATNVVKRFETDHKIDVVYGHTAIIDGLNRIVKIQYAIPWPNLGNLRRAHFAPGVFYRRNVALEYKLDPTLNYAMDYEQMLRMCKNGIRFGYINEVLIGYRRHRATKSMSQRASLKAETESLRKVYGERFGVSYYFSKYLDDGWFLIFKLFGIKNVVDLHVRPNKFQLAFDTEFDSLQKLILRQIIPFLS